MSRSVAYFNNAVKKGNKKLIDYFVFMNPESPSAARLIKFRVLNSGYKLFHA